MPEVTANGIKIHYQRTGGNGPALVLLHGVTDSGECWPRVVDALKNDHDIIAPDARAHGLSDTPPSGYTYDNMAGDVAGLIRALGLAKLIVLGHSMGAETAAVLGAHFPGLCRALILEDPLFHDESVDPATGKLDLTWFENEFAARARMSVEQIIEDGKARQAAGRPWDGSEWEGWAQAKKQVHHDIAQLIENPPPPWREIVAKLTCPVLLLRGDTANGALVSADRAQEVSALNPRIQVAYVPNTGHNMRRGTFPRSSLPSGRSSSRGEALLEAECRVYLCKQHRY